MGALTGKKMGRNGTVNTGIEYARSKENYSVLNNANTPFNPSDDRTEARANSDFSRLGAGISASSAAFEKLGIVRMHFVAGHEYRGLPGAVETPGDARLKRTLVLGGVSGDKLSLDTGVQNRWYVGETHDSATASSKQNNSESETSQWSTFAGWNIAIPDVLFAGNTGLAINAQHTTQNGETHRVNIQNENATQSILHFAISRSAIFTNQNSLIWSIDGSIRGSFAQNTAKRTCATGTIATDCGLSLTSQDPLLWSGHTGAQTQLSQNSSAFLRLARASRRPFIQEKMGSVSGVIPNAILKPEVSQKVTAGIALPFAIASCYYAYDTNLIFFQQVDALRIRAHNLDRVTRTGCQQQLSHTFWNNFTSSASYSWTSTSVKSPSFTQTKELPRTPTHTVQIAGSLDDALYVKTTSGWRLSPSTEFVWRSPMYLDGANFVTLNIPPQWNSIISLHESSTNSNNGNLAFSLELENVLDERSGTRSDSAGHAYMVEHSGYSGFPPPGRRLFIRAEWQM
jgi:outer membrane receptor for ferrienterochelin and colicin